MGGASRSRVLSIRSLVDRGPPVAWSDGGKIPWDDPDFSARMLREHLCQEHDRASRRQRIIAEQVAWLDGEVLRSRPSRILDLGCGPGLYCAALAERGHTCRGLDFSPKSIEWARSVARERGLACEYELSDLRTATISPEWDLVVMLSGELNTFPRQEALGLLRRIQRVLGPGGRLVLEVHTEEAVQGLGCRPPTWTAHASGLFASEPHLVLRDCAWIPPERVSVERYLVLTDSGRSETISCTTQAYAQSEYAELLSTAGLRLGSHHPCLTGRDTPLDGAFSVIVAAPA